MPNLTRDLEQTQGDRFRCPLCRARRGLSLDQDEGQTGVWHCFSCEEGGTGAELYAEMHNIPIAEALDAFGIESGAESPELPDKRPKPTWDPPAERMAELHRAWSVMNGDELELREEYRLHRVQASERRDKEAFKYWHRKWKELHRHVLEREMHEQRTVDRLDANTKQHAVE